MLRLPKRQKFWGGIRGRAFATLVVAVGLTFTSMGFLGDITALDRQPFSHALYGGLLSGVTAALFLLSFARTYAWLLVAIALQIAGSWFLAGPAHAAPFVFLAGLSTEARLQIDSACALFTVISGYNAFLVFITREGKRQVTMSTELSLAQQMHRSLVPPIARAIAGVTFHGTSDPSGQVGGDLVDVVDLPDDGWLAYVADVSGHGVSSGLVMGMVKSAVRMAADGPFTLPTLAGRLNTLMCSQLTPGTYVTFAILRGDASGRLDVLVAGHPPLLRVGRGRPVESVATDNVPLGVIPTWTFASTSITMQDDELLVLLTDGLFEVFDRKDRDLGLAAVQDVLMESCSAPLDVVAARVFDRARAFGPQLDDQSLLLVRRE